MNIVSSVLPVSALTISNIQPGFTGNWECRIRTSRGNNTRTVHIEVLESSAKYCAPERVSNNKGEFRFVRICELHKISIAHYTPAYLLQIAIRI